MRWFAITIITRRRSVAERGECFQRRLFVCLFVSQHDNFRTIKRRMMSLGGEVHCTKNLVRVRRPHPWVPTPQNVAVC